MISASGTHSLLLYGRLDGISDSYTGRCHILEGLGPTSSRYPMMVDAKCK